MKGKEKCEILKAIRKELAEQNNINIQFDECTHSGDCKGTCPKCDAELRYIDDELKKEPNAKKLLLYLWPMIKQRNVLVSKMCTLLKSSKKC